MTWGACLRGRRRRDLNNHNALSGPLPMGASCRIKGGLHITLAAACCLLLLSRRMHSEPFKPFYSRPLPRCIRRRA
jgi:hypothetical protein